MEALHILEDSFFLIQRSVEGHSFVSLLIWRVETCKGGYQVNGHGWWRRRCIGLDGNSSRRFSVCGVELPLRPDSDTYTVWRREGYTFEGKMAMVILELGGGPGENYRGQRTIWRGKGLSSFCFFDQKLLILRELQRFTFFLSLYMNTVQKLGAMDRASVESLSIQFEFLKFMCPNLSGS